MKIGEIVEILIQIRDNSKDITRMEDEALIEACNLLDVLPRMEDGVEYIGRLKNLIESGAKTAENTNCV